jgi:tetratricopeptide (TPR) repeat protein
MVFRVLLLVVELSGPEFPQGVTHPLERALALFNAGKYQDSFDLASRYLQQNPGSEPAHKIVGMNEYMLGRPQEALRHVKRATELAPNDADAFYYLGRLHFSTDNVTAALSDFQRALELDPSSVRTENQLGQTYEALGRWPDAERAYLKAIEIERSQAKKSEWPYFNLGVMYLNTMRAEEAVAYLQEALRRNPSWAQGKVKLAAALASCEKIQQALTLLEGAVESEPGNAEAHYRLALLLTKTGKAEEAKKHFDVFEQLLKR